MPNVFQGDPATGEGRFAIVVSRYNESITGRLLDGALGTLTSAGVADEAIDVAWVPGAWEIPLIARRFAQGGAYRAVLCLGAVIRGETTHDEHINRQVSLSLGNIALETAVPVLFGVLTCNTLEQAIHRSGGNVGNKGVECARAALEMASLWQQLPSSPENSRPFERAERRLAAAAEELGDPPLVLDRPRRLPPKGTDPSDPSNVSNVSNASERAEADAPDPPRKPLPAPLARRARLGAKLPQSTPPAARPQREPRPGVAEQRRPSTRRTRRSRARGVALQVLYEDDLNPQRNMATSAQFLKRRLLHDPELVAFAQSLVDGVRLHRAELDRILTDRLQNWSLQRMAVTDRNVLRLGTYEILFGGTPGPVAINEAVELARRFGSQHSAHFVNGVLDRVFRAPGDR